MDLKSIIRKTLNEESEKIDTYNSLVKIIRNAKTAGRDDIANYANMLLSQRNTAGHDMIRDELENFILRQSKFLQ